MKRPWPTQLVPIGCSGGSNDVVRVIAVAMTALVVVVVMLGDYKAQMWVLNDQQRR